MATISKRTTDGGERRWDVRIVTGQYANGKAKQTARTFKTRKEADSWAREEETRVANHTNASPGRQSVDAYLTEWLTRWARHVRPSTLAGYTKLLDLYIRPRLGRLLVRDASPSALQRILDALPTPAVAMHCRRVLHVAFEDAARLGLVTANPIDRTKTPPHQARQSKAWTEPEAQQFLAAAKDDAYEPFWTLALCSGMRPEELLALTWGDIDMTTGRVTVSKARATVGSVAFDGAPKSQAGNRAFTLAPAVVDRLRAQKTRQNSLRSNVRPLHEQDTLVCASAANTPIELRNIARRMAALCKAAGVPRRSPRELRHTATSLMLANGENLKAVSELLGHSDPRLTVRVYQHGTESQRSKALAGLGASLLGASDDPPKAVFTAP